MNRESKSPMGNKGPEVIPNRDDHLWGPIGHFLILPGGEERSSRKLVGDGPITLDITRKRERVGKLDSRGQKGNLYYCLRMSSCNHTEGGKGHGSNESFSISIR